MKRKTVSGIMLTLLLIGMLTLAFNIQSIKADSLAITVLSPENNKKYTTTSIPLMFTVNDTTSWIGYSLDNGANITITGNTTLTVSEGGHDIVVFANDTAGNMASSNEIPFEVDVTPPEISDVSQTPSKENVYLIDEVEVDAYIPDDDIKRVTLNYTNGNGTWIAVDMEHGIIGPLVYHWTATIPAFPYGTNVTYIIVAEDYAGNIITTQEMGYDYEYQVIPEFSSSLLLLLFMIATLLAVIIYGRKH